MKPHVVAIAVDAGFFPPAAFLADRLAALNPRDDVEIVLVSDSVPLLEEAREARLPVTLVPIDPPHPLPSMGRVTGATYYRVFLHEILGPSVRRILYLDADVIPASRRLFSLFDLDIGGHVLAAARDLWIAFSGAPAYEAPLRAAGAEISRRYFNAGVLLIDCEAARRSRLGERALALGRQRHIDDQSALNITCSGDWCELSPTMNMTRFAAGGELGRILPPAIVHYVGDAKLWNLPDDPHYRRMESFLGASPWRSFLPSQRRFPQRPGRPLNAATRRYLFRTQFADVLQGITPPPLFPRPSPAIPASPIPAD